MSEYTFEMFLEFVERAIKFINEKENTLSDEQRERIRQAKERWLEPDFDEYEFKEGQESDAIYHLFQETVYIAIYVTEEKSLFDSVFSMKGSPTPWIFLNGASLLKISYFNQGINKLKKYYYEASKDISLKRLIDLFSESDPGMENISEYEYFDLLKQLSPKDASILIDLIDSSRQIKNNLKLLLKENDEEEFCNICVSDNLHIAKSAGIGTLWYSIGKINRIISVVLPIHSKEGSSQINGILEEFYSDQHHPVNKYELSVLADVQQVLKADVEPDDIASINYYNMCELLLLDEGICVYRTYTVVSASTNLKAVNELKRYIMSIPYYKGLLRDLNPNNILEYKYRCYPPLDSFRDYFVSQRTLPDSLKVKKPEQSYIMSENIYDTNDCIYFYQELVKSDILDASDEAFYSFVYRTSIKYIGEKDPTVITWKGAPRELYYFIKRFAGEGDTRLWAKTANFFVFQDGNRPKTNGVKNQTQTSSPRMEALVKRLFQ